MIQIRMHPNNDVIVISDVDSEDGEIYEQLLLDYNDCLKIYRELQYIIPSMKSYTPNDLTTSEAMEQMRLEVDNLTVALWETLKKSFNKN